ncbi:unnamed protein product [Ceratitis capitata]|uniref:(Mediterranean fruit fly) hypothetical protein n=1 Tax=Ceratitis capitata TaxID=7213 RepID=A0A811ULE0_CERCA|nr:unnamed protein product [Ceratitis capitata]
MQSIITEQTAAGFRLAKKKKHLWTAQEIVLRFILIAHFDEFANTVSHTYMYIHTYVPHSIQNKFHTKHQLQQQQINGTQRCIQQHATDSPQKLSKLSDIILRYASHERDGQICS